MRTIRKVFYLHNENIAITIQTITNSENEALAKIDHYRNIPSLSSPTLTDWEIDTELYFNELSLLNLNDKNSYRHAFLKVCLKHIKDYNRLIDADLFNYIDESIIVMKHLAVVMGTNLPLEIGKELWQQFKDEAFRLFAANIWINIHTSNPLQPTKLVRYLDFKSGDY